VRRRGEADEAVEFVAVLGLMEELDASTAIREVWDGAGVAMGGCAVEEGQETSGVPIELVEVGGLGGEGWMIGAPRPTADEGGLIADGVGVEFDHWVDGVGLEGGVCPGALPRVHCVEDGGLVRAALGEEEVRVALEVGADGEGHQFTVEGQPKDVTSAGRRYRGAEGVGGGVEVLVPLGVAGVVGLLGGSEEESGW
jgi:hypothetical protein